MCWRTLGQHENDVGTWAPEHVDTCLFSKQLNPNGPIDNPFNRSILSSTWPQFSKSKI